MPTREAEAPVQRVWRHWHLPTRDLGRAGEAEERVQTFTAKSVVAVAFACRHGRQKRQCKECGGSGICLHGMMKRACKERRGGIGISLHGRQKSA